MVKHEPIVAVVHFQKCCTGEPHIGPEFNESTLCETEVIVRIGEANDQLLWNERLRLIGRAAALGNTDASSTTAIFSGWKPARRRMRAEIDHLLSLSRISISFQSFAERCMASTTCAAVTIDRAERNQPVPRIPSVLGVAFLSSSLNSLVMLTVERTSVEGSMHDASIPVDVALRTRIENKHWRIAPSPDCASCRFGGTQNNGPTKQ